MKGKKGRGKTSKLTHMLIVLTRLKGCSDGDSVEMVRAEEPGELKQGEKSRMSVTDTENSTSKGPETARGLGLREGRAGAAAAAG